MFGHKKGAFTDASADRIGRFELANKGTIFLDEIGDLDLSCEVKLLRVLQDQTFEVLGDSRPRKVDVRVVSVYVVVEELIPEMSVGEHSNSGTVFFAVGFSLMMALDVALG